MKASETNPTAWAFGMNRPKTTVLMRRWVNIRKNVRRMEDMMLELMQNPQTTQEQLSLAAKMYADMTKQLHEAALMIDEYIYHGKKPDPIATHMMSCAARATLNVEDCNCKDWGDEQ
jgi:hypothetical protein